LNAPAIVLEQISYVARMAISQMLAGSTQTGFRRLRSGWHTEISSS
jgi:hypothetical protein